MTPPSHGVRGVLSSSCRATCRVACRVAVEFPVELSRPGLNLACNTSLQSSRSALSLCHRAARDTLPAAATPASETPTRSPSSPALKPQVNGPRTPPTPLCMASTRAHAGWSTRRCVELPSTNPTKSIQNQYNNRPTTHTTTVQQPYNKPYNNPYNSAHETGPWVINQRVARAFVRVPDLVRSPSRPSARSGWAGVG